MKIYFGYTAAALLLCLALNSPQTTSAQRGRTAKITGRIFFGQQMGGQAVGPCSAIMVRAVTANKTVEKAATGPNSGAKGGQCTFTLTGVPAGVPIELKAVYSDLISKPEDTYPAPAGNWTNPFTLKPGEKVNKYIKIDGKP